MLDHWNRWWNRRDARLGGSRLLAVRQQGGEVMTGKRRRALMTSKVMAGALLLSSTAAWAQGEPLLIAKSEKVYADKKCALCHVIKGKGGKAGPELSDVGTRRDAPWLRSFMKEPKAVAPKAKMLPFKGSEEELEALVAYLGSLK